MTVCAACGLPQARPHRFCPECGTPLTLNWLDPLPSASQAERPRRARPEPRPSFAMEPQRRPLAERKQVTVLFVDLCNSTAQVGEADPEEAREFLDGPLRLMRAAVESYGGTVSQLLGDGLLALFGAPVAQEDHAQRACLAALAMQQRAREASAQGEQRKPMELRIGIASGEAIVGVASEYGWSYYRADGLSVHLAARLEKMAPPGSVWVAESTFRLVEPPLRATPLGKHEVRGLDDPVVLYELTPASQGSATAPIARRHQWAPLIGREGILSGLGAIVSQVLTGRMQAVGIRGEAGIGKSRLIAELCASPCIARFNVCTVQARAYLSRSPYSVAAHLMRELLGLPAEMERAARWAGIHPRLDAWGAAGQKHLPVLTDLLDLGTPGDDWLSLSSAQRRRRIGDTLHWLITQRLGEGPLLVVVEDIFLADWESQHLLETLVPRLERCPVLVCASYRPDFKHRWADAPWFFEQWVGPLQAHEMSALAGALLGHHESLSTVVAELIERADGNPFFLEQLAITLIDDGSLVGPPGSYRLVRTRAEVRVPASIAAVIGARVDRLPAATKASLEAAAILGEPISIELVAAMHGLSAVEAQSHLTLCAASGLLATPQAHDPAGYSFRHALVQEVLTASLSRPRRQALHRSAFTVLRDRLDGQTVDGPSVLAHHAYSGEEWADAAGWAVKAMSRAVARSASREALRLFDIGMDAARRLRSADKMAPLEMSLLLAAIGARMPLGQIDKIVADVERAGEIAKQLGDQRRMATVALQLAVFLWMRGKYTQGLVYAEQASEAGVRDERRHLQMAAAQARMMMHHGLGRYRDAIEDAHGVQQGFATELLGKRMLAGWATVPSVNMLSFLASSKWRLFDLAAAQETCDAAYRELAEFDHPYSRGLIDFVQGQMWVEQGRFDDAVRLLRASVRMCEVNDVPTLYPCVVAMLGGALARNGQAPEAVTLLEKVLADGAHLAGGTYGELFLRHNLGLALMHCGQHAQAIEMAQNAVDFATAGEQHGHRAEALFGLAETLVAAGRTDVALQRFQDARAQALQCEMPYFAERAKERLQQIEAGR